MAKIRARTFGGEKYRLIQQFSTKAMAQSFAKGLRKQGIMGGAVKVRVTEEKGTYPYKVWVRGK